MSNDKNPPKPAPPPAAPTQSGAPPPAAAPPLPEGKELTLEQKVAAAEAEKKKLEDEKKLEKLEEEIAVLKHGARSPAELKRMRAADAKRAKTFSYVTDEGKKMAKYQTREERFMGGAMVKKDSIIDIPFDILPGDTLLAVEPKKPTAEQSFSAKTEA